jgi:SlyX protein
MTTEERLVELEIKVARQEDLLDTLNQTIYQQQKKLDELETLCMALVRHLKDVREETSGPMHERPPHY